jgi:hypothetical protein
VIVLLGNGRELGPQISGLGVLESWKPDELR